MADKRPVDPATPVEATALSLGNLGTLLHVRPPSATGGAAAPSDEKVAVVVVLDASGSMGSATSELGTNAIPAALGQLAFAATTPVHVVTFESNTTQRDCPLSAMSSLRLYCNGLTYMADTLDKIAGCIKRYQGTNTRVLLMVFSDGDLTDAAATVTAADALRRKYAAAPHGCDVDVLLFRVDTGDNRGSTSALACLGMLATHGGPVPVCTIPGRGTGYAAVAQAAIVEMVRQSEIQAGSSASVGATLPVLSRWPGDVYCTAISLSRSATTAFLLAPADSDSRHAGDGDAKLTVAEQELVPRQIHARDEFCQLLIDYLRRLDGQIRLEVIAASASFTTSGSSSSAGKIAWAARLQQELPRLLPPAPPAPEADGEHALAPLDPRTTGGRMQALTARVALAGKKDSPDAVLRGLFLGIAELGNQSSVNALTEAQKAEWLRGGSGTVTKDLARRVNKSTGGSVDFDGLCHTAIRAYVAAHPDAASEDNTDAAAADVSFYSLEGWSDMDASVRRLHHLLSKEGAEVTVEDILTLVGGIGMPGRVRPGTYVDPWSARFECLWPGQCLGDADLRSVESQTAATLECPGFPGEAITCVVPLRPTASGAMGKIYDAIYTPRGAAHRIGELHASLGLRGLMAPVAGDSLATTTAALLYLVVGEDRSQLTCHAMQQLRAQLAGPVGAYGRRLVDMIVSRPEDPRVCMLGADGVTGMLLPFAVAAAAPAAREALAGPGPLSGAFVRALWELESLTRVRYHLYGQTDAAKKQAIHTLLGIDLDASAALSPVGEPDEEEPASGMSHCVIPLDVAAACARAVQLPFLPPATEFIRILEFLHPETPGVQGMSGRGLCLGLGDVQIATLMLGVMSLSYSGEDSRFVKSTNAGTIPRSRFPDLSDAAACLSTIQAMSAQIYLDHYDSRMRAKRQMEQASGQEAVIARLLAAATIESFVLLLKRDPLATRNCSCHFFRPVLARLLDAAVPIAVQCAQRELVGYDLSGVVVAVPAPRLCFEKLAVLLSGRDLATGGVIWGTGRNLARSADANCRRGSYRRAGILFNLAGAWGDHSAMWARIEELAALS